MEILYLLLPIAIILIAVAVWAFFWAVDNEQFDDLEGPAHSILFDDDLEPTATEQSEPLKDSQKSTKHNDAKEQDK